MDQIKKQSEERIKLIHHLSKRIWKVEKWSSFELQNKCMDAWDKLGLDLDIKIKPLVPVQTDRAINNLIFGSGGFSTAKFQVEQYLQVKKYAPKPPVLLQGIVANKSEDHGCNAIKVSKKYQIPLVELDFTDWYHEYIDAKEKNPIRASRYWYRKGDPNKPSKRELTNRFKIRQDEFHKTLGEKIAALLSHSTDIVSARGYNFQFCSNIFQHQKQKPQINDTHPADLTYVNSKTKEKLYSGWQANAVQLMLNDRHKVIRGSLIEVDYMDRLSQIEELDEGALLAIGAGINQSLTSKLLVAKEIQSILKLIDDYVFCTLEPTGLLLTWGISEKPYPVSYQSLDKTEVIIQQHLVVVGNQIRSGVNTWGRDLKTDLKELEKFLFSN
ncbi:MAG: hypothetical protein ACFFC7_15680 [Candidatus Hermodarchaeota archaeon]